MARSRALVLLLVAVAPFASGCSRGRVPPYAGEWVSDGTVDPKGVITPVEPGKEWALRFDPPATVSSARYYPKTGSIDAASINTAPYVVWDKEDQVVQFGALAAKAQDGYLMLAYPGEGSLRMSRPTGGRLFPKIRPVNASEWIAKQRREAEAEDSEEHEENDAQIDREADIDL